MLDWWEHLHVVVDEPLPGGRSHVAIEDDAGDTVLDTELGPDEALLQIESDASGENTIWQLAPATAPGSATTPEDR